MGLFRSLSGFSLLISSAAALAQPAQLSGFATVGVSYNESEQYGFRTDVSVTDGKTNSELDFSSLSRLGIQLHKQFNTQWGFTGQWVLKSHPDYSLGDVTQLAFLSYSPKPNWTIKAGRTAFDLFMMSPYRNIGYAYTATHAPIEFYGLIPHRSIDGIELSSAHATDQGMFSTRWYYGKSKDYLTNFDFQWRIALDDIAGATLTLEQGNWLWRANYTQAYIDNEPDHYAQLRELAQSVPEQIWPQARDIAKRLKTVDTRLQYVTLGAKYDNGQYYVQSEIARVSADSDILTHLHNGYVVFGTRWQDFTVQLGYSVTHGKRQQIDKPLQTNPLADELHFQLERGFNYYVNDQSTTSLSTRYDFRADMAAKLQLEYIDLDSSDNQFMLRREVFSTPESFTVVSATIDWVF
ncbi:porin [Pseudoalteromonas ruthenica]|uniref:porin n=1 Tax=Pseudoalteromonas ruthenica TaxID=151081 RepID=UPI00241DF996|nr:porin [Pseudoalteromonas ruthenica]|tara:strand:+ start:67646 stop:68869 length:1224 start_codon:yes stop_codon:yes gene_type:complete